MAIHTSTSYLLYYNEFIMQVHWGKWWLAMYHCGLESEIMYPGLKISNSLPSLHKLFVLGVVFFPVGSTTTVGLVLGSKRRAGPLSCCTWHSLEYWKVVELLETKKPCDLCMKAINIRKNVGKAYLAITSTNLTEQLFPSLPTDNES